MSQSSISSKRPRQNNFSASELSLLADEVRENSKVLFGSFSSSITNQTKNKLWGEIAAKLSACSSNERNGAQIRKKWNDYKSHVKRKAIDVRRERGKTGGGAPPDPLSDLETKVVSLIPSCQIEGISGGLETDEFTETPLLSEGVQEATQVVPEASEQSMTDMQSDLISEPSSSSQIMYPSGIDVPVKKQKRKASTDVSKAVPQHVTSLIGIETDKRAILQEILKIQQEMLELRREEVALNRERLALEREKWEFKKPTITYTEESLSLSPIIKLNYAHST